MAPVAHRSGVLIQLIAPRLAQLLTVQGTLRQGAKSRWHARVNTNIPADAPLDEIDWAMHTELLRAQLSRAQARFKKQADRHRAERAFDVGKQVLLKM